MGFYKNKGLGLDSETIGIYSNKKVCQGIVNLLI